ncbi:MAG: hypothetical protein WCA07_09400 [Gloeobacterales cyanobacterium]
MATSPTKISDSGSPERVAYDLMLHITKTESPVDETPPDREYWLTLYCQCLMAASGERITDILKVRERQLLDRHR